MGGLLLPFMVFFTDLSASLCGRIIEVGFTKNNAVNIQNNILVLGASGNLGGKIARSLLAKGASVTALVRPETDLSKLTNLTDSGMKSILVDVNDRAALIRACEGTDCVVSAVSGLAPVVIGMQQKMLDASLAAGVPRFIPSDYCIDFRNLVPGKNRNLDLRRSFHTYLDGSAIQATSIFNGAFMDLVKDQMPLVLTGIHRILCWGDPDVSFDLTLTDDVADYTASAALDIEAPRYLHIAGARISARKVAELCSSLTGKNYKLLRPGSIKTLDKIISISKMLSPSRHELYPAWQGMQYMRDMMEGRASELSLDNSRYPVAWHQLSDYLLQNKLRPGEAVSGKMRPGTGSAHNTRTAHTKL